LTIQAYFDDSGAKGQGRYMSMCGLLGEAEVFAALSDEWSKALEGPYPPGRIEYFKIDEAVTLDGQFRHWSDEHRDQKVSQLAKLIDRGDILKIGARIDLHAFSKMSEQWNKEVIVRATPGQKYHAMDEPYLQLFLFIFTTAVTEAVARGAKAPIDIVFDHQDQFRPTITSFYPDMRTLWEVVPNRLAVMPYHPMFRDDRDFLPLQAADMLAGELRLQAEGYPDNPDWIGTLCPSLPVSKWFTEIGEAKLAEIYAWNLATVRGGMLLANTNDLGAPDVLIRQNATKRKGERRRPRPKKAKKPRSRH
jgi:hypothetical protein